MTVRERHEQWANETSVCTHSTNPTRTTRCLLLHHRVYTSPSKTRTASRERVRGGDECCGRNLHRTGCRPLHDHRGGIPLEGAKGATTPLVSFVRFARRAALHRVASSTSCTLRILHTKHMRTLTPATIRALDYIAGTDELDVSNNNVQRLSDGSAEIAFCPRTTGSGLVRRRNAFAFAVSLQLQLCRNSELTMILTVYRCTLRQYRNC